MNAKDRLGDDLKAAGGHGGGTPRTKRSRFRSVVARSMSHRNLATIVMERNSKSLRDFAGVRLLAMNHKFPVE